MSKESTKTSLILYYDTILNELEVIRSDESYNHLSDYGKGIIDGEIIQIIKLIQDM